MAPATLRYLDKRVKRSGLVLWYFRHPTVPRTRVPGQPGEPAFHREYSRLLALVAREEAQVAARADARSIGWLVLQYAGPADDHGSDEWQALSAKTRRDYRRELDRLVAMAGDLPFAALTAAGVREMRKRVKADVVAAREAAIAERARREAEAVAAAEVAGRTVPAVRRAPPKVTTGARTADYFKSVLSALFAWAIENDHAEVNPAEGMKRLHRKKNVEARTPWTDHQIQHAILHGPRWIADGVILGSGTGQRLGDCCRMNLRRCVGPDVRVKQQKTGTLVDVRATGDLVRLIARRRGANDPELATTLLLRDNGQAYSERLFSDHLRDWLDEQGWTDISFHGLRYAAAGRLNEAGATVATIVSIIGHQTYQMAVKYLAAREEAQRAARLLEGDGKD